MEGRKFTFFRMRRLLGSMIFILSFMALAACGGGGGSDSPAGSSALTGVFVDSAVQGLNYSTTTMSGTTGSNGAFNYAAGETVTFSIGNLALGSAAGAATLTPLSITSGAAAASEQIVNNKLILLQTLDADGDINNGIQITDAIRTIVSANAASINFDQTSANFITNCMTPLLSALNGATSSASVFSDTYRWPRTAKAAADALAHFTRTTGTRVTVTTTYGQLRGFQANSTTWQWLGVPYAKAPVGNLRWKPPQTLEAWSGIREATEWGNQAAQLSGYAAAGSGGASEDCLNLNITAPKDASNLPVMVWFHGGAFGILSANTAAYNNPDALTTKGVVLVSINARLGAFGYLAHPLLTTESGYGGSGNYGQMDLIKALQWIRDNISAFGGNPDNVTIFGQSGGGGKAISLMASPLAAGLFHKVICESGIAVKSNTVLNHTDLETAETVGADLFNRLSVTTLEQARALPASAIILSDYVKSNTDFWLFYKPNIDNHYLTDTMENLIKNGLASDVPLMAGTNSYDHVAGANLGPGITEQMPWRANRNLAKQYVYYWNYVPPGWNALNVGAYHGLELIYVFNSAVPSFVIHYQFGLVLDKTTGLPPTIPDYGLGTNGNILVSTGYFNTPVAPYYLFTANTASAALADDVMTVWTNFAKTGNPSATGIVNWPDYTSTGDAYVEIAQDGTFTPKTGVATAFGTP